MLIGIDVGGTNIDGVIIQDKKIIKKVKLPVNKERLFETIHFALEELICDVDVSKIQRINLSTTISTNAIIEGKTEEVLLIIQSGPGIQNDFPKDFNNIELIGGYVDHRGKIIKDLQENEIINIKNNDKYKDINSLGIITKFSTRNPESEIKIKDILIDKFDYISLGHSLSGNLNFPRRVNTAYLNSSVSKVFSHFLEGISNALEKKNISAPINILKADGGTISVKDAYSFPVQSILSGPAASFMGISALEDTNVDSIYIDIGGTTTDIFFLVDGMPLFEPIGIEINAMKTLVRSIFSHSIGLGGDSNIQVLNGKIKIGPERLDKPMILGGIYPTITDAMAVLDLVDFGDREKAFEGIGRISKELNLNEKETSKKILEQAAEIIYLTVEELLEKINAKPLFTVREVLENRKLTPKEIKIIGGPAEVLSKFIEDRFNLNTIVTDNFEIANAIGAALSRPTFEINLHADTVSKMLSIPEENLYERISQRFSLEDGRKMVVDLLKNKEKSSGEEFDVEIVEENSFNMVDGYSFGINIRIKGQIKPGLTYKIGRDKIEG